MSILFLAQYGYQHLAAPGAGETMSEGGFAKNKVSAASLLDASVAKDKSGKTYYKYSSSLMQHCCHSPLYLPCIAG